MTEIIGQPKWSPIRLLEEDEFATAGENGNMNEHAKSLADRTEYLNQEKASKSEITQGHFEFDTYASFNIATPNLPLNCSVIINEENQTGTGQWSIGSNSWNGIVLKKSAYDPFEKSKAWVNSELGNDILRPFRIKNLGLTGSRFNKAVKSLSLRGDHNGKLITVSIAAYVNGVFTLVLARPDSKDEQMSSTNSKIVARFSGAVTFSGVQTLTLEPYSNLSADISGEIVIDFSELLQTDQLSSAYIASDRLIDNRAIIDLNGQYNELKDIKTNIVNLDGKTNTLKTYVDVSGGIIFRKEDPTINSTRLRLNRAIKSISLRGDYNGKLITLAAVSYVNGIFTIQLARPDSKDEVMSATSNTKFVARFTGALTFSGVQTLTLSTMANSISGEIVIDFGELLTTDLLQANYTASERLFDNRAIIDLNATYLKINSIDTNLASNTTSINKLNLVFGSDVKNTKINDAIEEIVFFKPLPADKYLILAGLFYSSTNVVLHIYAADDTNSRGVLWFQGQGEIGPDNRAKIIFDQGYAIVRMNLYYPTNVGAAVLTDNATYETRGINKHFIKRGVLDTSIYQRYANQFVDSNTFHIPTDYLQRSVKLFVKGEIANTDYYVLSALTWSFTNNKYRLAYQIRKMSTPDQDVNSGLPVYSGTIDFDSLEDIKGIVTVTPAQLNGHPSAAELEIDFKELKYRTDYNSIFSPYIFHKAGNTFANSGFDIAKLRKASSEHFKSSGTGLTQYSSLKDALAAKEKGLFAIGGNIFKSRTKSPLLKEDFICMNSPPKLLTKKPKKSEYDFFYKQKKARLEIIDADDNFYFVNSDVIFKATHPMKQAWTEVASANAADFVVFDVANNKFYSIPNLTELFTKASLTVDSIFQARLTYDDELFIIAVIGGNKSILITENAQTALRTFNFNGTTATRYTFGAGVNVVKDWCMSHHKNIMFVSDYDSGVNGVRGTTGGQKCYVSTDNGYTFTKCFDFTGNDWSRVVNASNITSFGAAQAHIHAVTYDPKQNVVWIVTGDGAVSADNSSFFWSRDLGQTWTHKRTTLADNGARSQMIMALPFDGCVAFGSDDSSLNGLGVITYDGDNMVHEVVKNYANKNVLLSFARSTWSRPTSPVKYMSFGKDAQQISDPDAKSFVVASSNGYLWEMIWEDSNTDIYGNVFSYDDCDGKVYISLDGLAPYKERVIMLSASYN
ncbi:hypothetical protein KTH15_13490 [Acinetobacter pittii]|uniref:hypothetical protein n=1 Tax=Acinetobacter pittii TaxID=48296 RepID=UPI0021CDCE15|nr:hypothetical protein [Acinetobacter pittii]MCU4341771.1 hypothetical protein [Acinetobacter pittii]